VWTRRAATAKTGQTLFQPFTICSFIVLLLFFLKSKRTEAKQLIANSRFEDVNTLLPLPFLRYFFGISSLFTEEIPKKFI